MFLADFCYDSVPLMNFLHTVLVIFKIVIPVLLIIFGMIDLGKAVVSSDEKAIKQSTSSLIKKLVAALVIFFLPTIVSAIVNLTGSEKNDEGQDVKVGSTACIQCVTDGCSQNKDTKTVVFN